MDSLDALPWPAISAATGGWILTAAFVWAVLKGRLIPRTQHDDMIHDRNEWRTESRIKDQQIAEKDSQLRHLVEVGETTKAVLTGVQQIAQARARGED